VEKNWDCHLSCIPQCKVAGFNTIFVQRDANNLSIGHANKEATCKNHATRIRHSNCAEEYGLVLLLVMQLMKLHVKLGNKYMRHSSSYACTSVQRHQTTTHWTKPINFNHVQQFHLPQVQNTNDIVCRWDGLTTKMIYSGLVSFDVDSKSPSCEKYYSSK
jgi:hypothetical protein